MLNDPLPPFVDGAEAESAVIRNYCRWHVWPVITETVVVDSAGGRSLMLPTLNLLDVSEVSVESYYWPTLDALPVDVTALKWSRGGWVRYRNGGCWPDEPQSVTLTIEHGYDLVPEIVQLCRQMVARNADAPSGKVLTSVTTGGKSESYAVAAYESELARLDAYRLP
jgi:hypothetical protein